MHAWIWMVPNTMQKIHFISDKLKTDYGQKIYKLSLQSGCTCPNRDGSKGTGGCTFCSEGGSGDFAAPVTTAPDRSDPVSSTLHAMSASDRFELSLNDQITYARKLVDTKIPTKINGAIFSTPRTCDMCE